MKSFHPKFLGSTALLLAILAAGAGLVWWTVMDTDQSMRADLLQQTHMAAQSLDMESVKTLTGSAADLDQPAYLQLKEQFAITRAAIPQCKYVYLMGRRQTDGQLFFFVDNEPLDSKDYTLPGTTYEEAAEEFHRVFLNNSESVVGPKTDRWGTWISGLVPLRNWHDHPVREESESNTPSTTSDESPRAVLGIDVDARKWNQLLLRAALPPALLTLVLTLLLAAGIFLLGRRADSKGLTRDGSQHLERALVAAFGLVLTVYVTWMVHHRETQTRHRIFARLAANRIALIADLLQDIQYTELESLARFFENSNIVEDGEFQHYTANLTKNPKVQAWGWMPAVPAAGKPDFEAQVRASRSNHFEIWQKDALGKRVPATGRKVYYPVLQVAPLAANEMILGYDTGSEPLRGKALEEATRSGLVTATEPITLLQETGSQKGMLIYRPVFDGENPPRFRGLVGASVRMGTLLENAPKDYATRVEISLLKNHAAPALLSTECDATDCPDSELSTIGSTMAYGRVFGIKAHASPDYLRSLPVRSDWLVALTGLGLSAAFFIKLSVLLRRREELEDLVVERACQLQIKQERYARLSEHSATVIWEVDSRGLFTYASEASTSVVGYRPDELIDRLHFYDLHPEPKRQAVKTDTLAGFARKDSFHELVSDLQTKDGQQIWASINAIPTLNPDGTLKGYSGSLADITQRKQTEDALRDSESRLRAITDSAYDAIAMMDPQGNITYWNPAAQRILGHSRDEALGQCLHSLITPARFRPAFEAAFPSFLTSGQGAAVGKTLDVQALHKDGHEIDVQIALSAIHLDGAWHSVGVMRDVTERKRAQEELRKNKELAEQANEAKSMFLANMSHEIRTPMNGVIGMTELLLDTPLNPEQRHFAQIVRSSGESLLHLINDILDFSKIEAGKFELEILDFDLAPLLDDFSKLLAPQAQNKGLAFHCRIDPDVPQHLSGDPSRLRQVLFNLVGNALKFTPRGSVTVQVSCMSVTEGAIVLRFAVRDTGIGIPTHKQALLFEKFTQLDASTSRQYGGTGLGLAICKQLVELMDGEIGLSSTVGQGTEFWFTSCFAPALHPKARAQAELPKPQWPDIRVLLVEDSPINQKVALGYLKSFAVQADVVDNGAAAIQALRTRAYGLVFMDMQMPEMDGLEATRRIRAAHPGVPNAGVPIIAMTANVMQGDREKCLEAGMDDYLSKPVTPGSLTAILEKWMPRHPAA
jgi:PAS domain S-box-containing protein